MNDIHFSVKKTSLEAFCKGIELIWTKRKQQLCSGVWRWIYLLHQKLQWPIPQHSSASWLLRLFHFNQGYTSSAMSQWLKQQFRVGHLGFYLLCVIHNNFRFALSKWFIIIHSSGNGRRVYIEVYICHIFGKNSGFMELISWMVTRVQSQDKIFGC